MDTTSIVANDVGEIYQKLSAKHYSTSAGIVTMVDQALPLPYRFRFRE
jgi:hypothetical protein